MHHQRPGSPNRITWLFLSLALGTAGTHARGASPPLKLTLSDPHGLTASSSAVRDEVESLLSDTTVAIRWIDEADPAAAAAADAGGDEVNIILTPSRPSGPGWGLKPDAMGVYLNHSGSGAVFVFYRRVASVLGLPAAGERLLHPNERRDLDRALARVAVHELVHRLAPDLPHAERGLMQGHLDSHALTRGRLPLDDTSREAVVSALSTARTIEIETASLAPPPR